MDGLQLELVGARELQEAVEDLVQALDFAADDVDVFPEVGGRGSGIGDRGERRR